MARALHSLERVIPVVVPQSLPAARFRRWIGGSPCLAALVRGQWPEAEHGAWRIVACELVTEAGTPERASGRGTPSADGGSHANS